MKDTIANEKIGDSLSKRLRESPCIFLLLAKEQVVRMLPMLKASTRRERYRLREMHQLFMKNKVVGLNNQSYGRRSSLNA